MVVVDNQKQVMETMVLDLMPMVTLDKHTPVPEAVVEMVAEATVVKV